MAKTITINISDVDEKILYDQLLKTVENDGVDNEGIKDWHEKASSGKINNAWKRFRQEWTQKLMDDSSFTDPIPSNKTDFVNLVTARSDYKTRQQLHDESNT
jgi:hypothetical protein|tara:strand:- start:2010 stop:2315 length:306 start_codon:yes stop_codon:yes gene_type:complete